MKLLTKILLKWFPKTSQEIHEKLNWDETYQSLIEEEAERLVCMVKWEATDYAFIADVCEVCGSTCDANQQICFSECFDELESRSL